MNMMDDEGRTRVLVAWGLFSFFLYARRTDMLCRHCMRTCNYRYVYGRRACDDAVAQKCRFNRQKQEERMFE